MAESKKLTLNFIGPVEISALVNPVSVRLKLPRNMRIHNVFRIKRFRSSPLCPPSKDSTSGLMDGLPTYSITHIIDSKQGGHSCQYLVDWEGNGLEERSREWPSWINACCGISTVNTLVSLVGHMEAPVEGVGAILSWAPCLSG